MGRVHWSLGLALAGVLLIATPVAARGGAAKSLLDVDRPLEAPMVPGRYADWLEKAVSLGGAQTITLTLAGFAPDVVSVYTDVPVAWLNLLPVTAHLHGGTPNRAYLPRVVGGISELFAPRQSKDVAAKQALGGLDVISASIAPGARFVYTFTTPGDYDYYASELLTRTGRISVMARPDLDLVSVAVNPMPVASGGTATISAVIANVGPGSAGPFSVTWRATPLWPMPQVELYRGTWSVASLSPGASILLTATQVMTQPGALNIVVDADAGDVILETTKSNNAGQAELGVLGTVTYCGDITGDAVWAYAVFVPSCSITVRDTATLTVRNGSIVKPMDGLSIWVDGRLNAVGDEGAPVRFTSFRDDAWGGDTNGDGNATAAAAQNWNAIHVQPGGQATLTWARLRYGGSGWNGNLNNQGLTALDHVVSELSWRGLWSGGGSLTITQSAFSSNIWDGVAASSTALTVTDSVFMSNTNGVGLGVTGGSLLATGSRFAANVGGLSANGGRLIMSANTVSQNSGIGVNVANIYAPVITGNAVMSNTSYAIYVSESAKPLNTGQIQANLLMGNGANAVVLGGSLNGESVLVKVPGVVYGIAGLSVNGDGTLLIEAGNVLKFMGGQTLSVYGILTVTGTLTETVVFTSLRDDSWGGDTNSDGGATAAAAQDWNAISVEPGGRASLTWARLRYGGSNYNGNLNSQGLTALEHVVSELSWRGLWSGGGSLTITQSAFSSNTWDGVAASSTAMTVTDSVFMSNTNGVGLTVNGGSLLAAGNRFAANVGGLTANGGSLTMSGNTISQNSGIGVSAANIYAPVITANAVMSNTSYAIYVSENSRPLNTSQIQENALVGNGANALVLGGALSGASAMVKVPGVVYGIAGLTVNGDGSLLVEAGNVLKFMGGQNLNVYGMLTVAGTMTDTVVFTSIRDDGWGGDTNSDGTVSHPAAQDWNAINVQDGGRASLIHALLLYGGSSYNGNLNNQGLTALEHVISELSWRGLWSGGGGLTITESAFSSNIWDGAAASNTALTVTNSVFVSNTNGAGLGVSGGTLILSGSVFTGNAGGLSANGGGVDIRSNTLSQNSGIGVNVANIYAPVITGNGVMSNTSYAIYVSENSKPLNTSQIQANTLAGNGANGVVLGGSLSGESALVKVPGVLYGIAGLTVNGEGSLRVEAGNVLKFMGGQNLFVYGTLTVAGTVSDTVVFTSIRDDGWGGDTNSDGAATVPAAQDWNAIGVQSGGRANLAHALLRYGGSSYNGNLNNQGVTDFDHVLSELGWRGLWSGGGSLTITESAFSSNIWDGAAAASTAMTVTDSVFMSNTNGVGLAVAGGSLLATGNRFASNVGGLTANGGSLIMSGNAISQNTGIGVSVANIYAPVITGNEVMSNASYAIYVSASAKPVNTGQIQMNALTRNGANGVVLGGSLNGESVLVKVPGVVYGIAGLTVHGAGSLLIEAGNVLKFLGGQNLNVYGTLTVAGTTSDTVVFTSIRDDGWGGDTNSDWAVTQAAAQDWNAINVQDGGRASLSWARLRFGGSSYNGNLNNQGFTALDHVVSELSWRGLWSGGGSLTITQSAFTTNIWDGAAASNSVLTVANSVFMSNTNGAGLALYNTLSPTISGNSFIGNATWGLNNGSANVIDARQNWWNSASGPTHPSNPGGNGDKVSDGVIFTPFLTSAP